VAYGVGVLRDGLLGFGLFAGAGHLGRLGFAGVHAAVRGSWQSTIAAGSPLASHTLAWGLTVGLQLVELGAQRGNFSKQGLDVHFWVGFWG
jgi:hypothetical protein